MNMNVKLESSEIIRPHIILPCPRMVAVASNTLLNDVPTITMYNYITSSYLQSDLRYNGSLRGVRSLFSSTVHYILRSPTELVRLRLQLFPSSL